MKSSPTTITLLVLYTLCTPAPAAARDADEISISGIRVSIGNCLEQETDALLAKLRLELAGLSPDVNQWILESQLTLDVSCAAGIVAIRVLDAKSGRFVEQRIENDEARLRYVALVAAELVVSTKQETIPQSPGEQQAVSNEQVPPTATPEPQKETLVPTSARLQLMVAPCLRLGGSPMWLAAGGSLGLELSVLDWLVLGIDAEVTYGRSEVSVGEIGSLLVSGTPLLLFRFPLEKMSLLFGPGFHLGAVVWKGEIKKETDAVGETAALPWHGPCLDLRAGFHLSPKIELGLNLQGGWLTYEADALVLGEPEISLRGGWLRVGLLLKLTLL